MNVPPPPDASQSALIDSLISGFDALLSTVRAHIENEKALRERLEFAANEYEKILAADSSLSASSIAPSEVFRQFRQFPAINTDIECSLPIREAQQAIQKYKMSKTQIPQTNGARCPMSLRNGDPEDLERDFTTPGVQGTLGCPFAKMQNGPGSSAHADPIAAEFHQDTHSARSPNAEQRPGQCPIRFLDQHSPEEMAKYFENHKHEIPRSHEICVRRYQGNEISARQLDAKYGNLVNMIQGLGVKHKAYLPERDRIDEHSTQAVEKWAENVSEAAVAPPVPDVVPDEEPRLSHFEKPLREVRVGESPSRPWGISVPVDKEPTPSALQDDDGVAHLKIHSASSRPVPLASRDDHPLERSPRTSQQKRWTDNSVEGKEARTQVIFNGPVFFGYSAEQVSALLQNTNLGNMKPGGG
ncbi:uncharacterized protein Z519_08948 [Cladophialophora bantiana CBS 173.52]|uniref:Uncharacterized protein n=1 Tax=Cladophialophora bantiana (strain ATCC 10958 / CBS 173.52 / CDC B-1940 / NIH 8579) TaxID=1442370 RepID=A0A0D2I0A0_CLAB1|nr:uncharacterized protein Z519_08948 [Cladophialophora bantiana CBS 173.52]KIW90304.1 hypothetical protein Z519_08948 [Cladophialophora bantiana CBS 173.52]